LEIEPEKQKTRIDFAATEELLGIKEICISDVIQNDKKLFYKNESKLIQIEKIYNRVIFDELKGSNSEFSFNYKDDLDVKWVTHPNWFFKISKFSLPLLEGKYVPECYYLNDTDKISDEINNYVLKPLFSFAGHGVDIDPTEEKIRSIKNKGNYILQHKIDYAPVIETPTGNSKIEIRMMFLWDKEPVLVNNLVRMSKGKMMGVDFNKNKTWVGSSQAFHFQ
jgi:glutathionylspermidine synthase